MSPAINKTWYSRCAAGVSHAAWPDDGVASSGMLRQQDHRGVISLDSWMTASDAGGGGGGAWLLATTKELANRTHVPYFFARALKNRQSHSIARILPHDQQTWRVSCSPTHRECLLTYILSSAGYIVTLSRIKCYANEWMNEWTNIAALFSSLREERLSCDVTLFHGENYDVNIKIRK